MGNGLLAAAGPDLELHGSALEAEAVAQAIDDVPLCRKVQLARAVGEHDESRRSYRGLRHVVDLDWRFDLQRFSEAVQLASRDALRCRVEASPDETVELRYA